MLWSDLADLKELVCGLVVGNLSEGEGLSTRPACRPALRVRTEAFPQTGASAAGSVTGAWQAKRSQT